MIVRKTATAVAAIALVLGFSGWNPSAHGADPYFVPYGAHRGRIHIGPRHARIRWGGGLTSYGASVLIHGFDVAGSVAKSSLGAGGGSGDGSGSMSSESAAESNEADCQEQLRKTKELLEETRKLCGKNKKPEAGQEPAAQSENPYARIQDVKRQVAESLPLIAELQTKVAADKKAIEDFQKVLDRDQKAFQAFVDAVKNSP